MNADAHARIDLLLGLRRFREAEALARECLAAEPESAFWHAQLARALFDLKRNEDAVAAARRAAALEPDNPWALANLGWLLIEIDRAGEALDVLHDALRVDPRCAWGYELLAAANARLHREEQEMAAARRAVELAPEDEFALIQLGWAQFGQRRFREAVATAEAGLRLHPESAILHNLIGTSLAYQADSSLSPRCVRAFRRAHGHLREALRLDPGESLYAENLLCNALAWRRAVYRLGLVTGLGVFAVVGYGVGYRFIGHTALAIVALLLLLAVQSREVLFRPPDYGLAVLPLGWAGLPGVPLSPEERSQGRGDTLRWAGTVLLGLAMAGGYAAILVGIYYLFP
jgi:tetratricopeptide (TPR) repeat protein